jgi:drug/metabolite transporter (DMT)-like permease
MARGPEEGEERFARRDDPMRGIPLMLGAILLFAVSDTLAKILTETLPAVEIAWLRYLGFLLLTLIPFLRRNAPPVRSAAPQLQVPRALGVVGSAVFFIIALGFMPIADASAISFSSPVFVTVLAMLFLGERIGWRRWMAIAVGLTGMLVIIRPGSGVFGLEALVPIASSAAWATAVIFTRRLATLDAPATTMLWTASVGFVVLTLLLPFVFVVPTPRELGIGLLIGAISTAAQGLVVLAYRAAPASVIAPFSYVQLIYAGVLGLVVFGTVPDGWTLLGAGIIAASGIYSAHRERVRMREREAAARR